MRFGLLGVVDGRHGDLPDLVATRLSTDRQFNRLFEPKAATEREASEGRRGGQGATKRAADLSEVSERAATGLGGACRRSVRRGISGRVTRCGRIHWRKGSGGTI